MVVVVLDVNGNKAFKKIGPRDLKSFGKRPNVKPRKILGLKYGCMYVPIGHHSQMRKVLNGTPILIKTQISSNMFSIL